MNERTSPGPVAAFWQLARPRTCLVGVLAYVFGFEITAGDWALRPALGILVALMVPAIANLHNTYTDVEEDRANLPGRAALVDVAQVRRLRWAVFGGLFAVVAIAGYSGLPQLIIALVGSLLLLAYWGCLCSLSWSPFRSWPARRSRTAGWNGARRGRC